VIEKRRRETNYGAKAVELGGQRYILGSRPHVRFRP